MENDHRESEPLEAPSNTLIEDYLDRITAPLVGWKDYDERQALRQEILSHLESGIAAYQELGESRDEAVRSALKQLGNPDEIGRQYLDTSQGFSSILRLTRVAGGFVCSVFGLVVGMFAGRIAAVTLNISGTADHSDLVICGVIGAIIGWRCWRRRVGILGGALRGAFGGTSGILGFSLIDLLLRPSGIWWLLANWAEFLGVVMKVGAIGAVAGAATSAFCRIIRKLERAPQPWVVD